jgi:3-amino-4-hydroxybenzoic acid synthase
MVPRSVAELTAAALERRNLVMTDALKTPLAVLDEPVQPRLAWVDLRRASTAVMEALTREGGVPGIDAVVSEDLAALQQIPGVRRVWAPAEPLPDDAPAGGLIDSVLVHPEHLAEALAWVGRDARVEVGVEIVVDDEESLRRACDLSRRASWTVLDFKDPTKIPLEIAIAAAQNEGGHLITIVRDVEDARVVFGVLEHGSDGVLLRPRDVSEAEEVAALTRGSWHDLDLTELTVRSISHVGMGDRACIDTCSHLGLDEGLLIGSFSHALFLAASETHALPYMPTRPFRVNAGAIHSYTFGIDGRTRYLSELTAGDHVLAVRTSGATRPVCVGRIKIERRPLLSVTAETPDGRAANLLVQNDWHVRVLGPAGAVRNVTELAPGDPIIGTVHAERRHVGYAVDEYCLER